MNDVTREEALAHFGVQGMRWGHRKSTSSGGGGSKSTSSGGGGTKSMSVQKSAKKPLTAQEQAVANALRRARRVRVARIAATSAALLGARLAVMALTGIPVTTRTNVMELTPGQLEREFPRPA